MSIEAHRGTADLLGDHVLDGYVADGDGNVDWAAPDEEVHTFVHDLERPVGTYLYGRRMYDVMVGWETAHTLADQRPVMRDFARIWQAADKIVYSTGLETVSSARTRIERAFDPGVVRQLKATSMSPAGESHQRWSYRAVMHEPWSAGAAGVLTLPSGRRVRGRALGRAAPAGAEPTFGLYLLASVPPPVAWESRWLRWPEFRLPADSREADDALRQVWRRLDSDRVEVACRGGRGRTGTALACLVVIDAGHPVDPVAYVREHYDSRAVETLWQRRSAARFPMQ